MAGYLRQRILVLGTTVFFMTGNMGWAADDNLAWMSLLLSTPDGAVKSAGQVWMDRNLGASQVATSSTDSDAYGDLYQWGRLADGHEDRASSETALNDLSSSDAPGHGDFILVNTSPFDWRDGQNDNLWLGVSGTNNPCPAGFRLPTETEITTERTSWGSDDAVGAFGSPLKLVMAGFRARTNGALNVVGSQGLYWSSTINASDSRNLNIQSISAAINNGNRAFGASVRCIKD